MDPPKHTKMRALVNKAFTPKAIKQIEEKIKDLTHDLLHQVKDQHTFDIVQDLAAPLPVMIIAELLGAEVKDRELIKKHSDALVAGAKDDSKEAVQAVVDMQKQAEKELSEYFAHLIQKRKETPADDLISFSSKRKLTVSVYQKMNCLAFVYSYSLLVMKQQRI